MKTFIVSDTHFNHKNIINLCNRPFSSVEEMNESIIKNWNSVVSKDDIVYHLGDFGFGNKTVISNFVSRLNGRIRLIKGNHDTHSNAFYRDCGFDEVCNKPIILDDFFICSHEPMPFVDKIDSAGCFANLFGHVHNSPLYETVGKNHFCVCIERSPSYAPFEYEDVKKSILVRNS